MIMIGGRRRSALMTGAALFGLVVGAEAANAQATLAVNTPRLNLTELENVRHRTESLDPNQVENVPHTPPPPISTAVENYAGQLTFERRPLVVIAEPGTPTTALDPAGVNGIGEMVATIRGSGEVVSGCTGTLINPRTVLFAAHCVNFFPPEDSDSVALGFGFNASNNSTLPGAPAGTSPLTNWLDGTDDRAPNTTSTAENFYTVNGVVFNPLSLEPAAEGFLYGDVAIASLDTPARNVPTWALLLSALTPPSQITAASGTGYHIAITGYGGIGVGSIGVTDDGDNRRRIAENWLGALTSIAVIEAVLTGGDSQAELTQNLYFHDFDDPRRGTDAASPFDINPFRDNALPREGDSAPGDSGSPLILDRAFARQLVIGVLSGGSFLQGQEPVTYGAYSFYQPVYLYWDWIAANNPYRYVGANAGSGNWEDPTRWVSLQDPNYFILGPDGQPVNGVPSSPGEQNLGSSGQFGQICAQTELPTALGSNNCFDLSTNTIVPTPGGIGSSSEVTPTGSREAPSAAAISVLPPATIANGLPGATNFVPNNTAGSNQLQGALPRYFDVTLANAGTTTLSSAVTIDRLTLRNTAGLTIAANGRLTSLIDVNQFAGTMTVNGNLTSVGDYALFTGLLQGTGRITAPFLTSMAGTISPGTAGTIGTLSLTGNLVLASMNQYQLDVAGAMSDRIAVTGRANVGGQVIVGTGIAGQVNGQGRQFTILTSTGGVSGTFAAQSLSPILSQRFTYQTNAVLLEIRAASYASVVNGSDPVQAGYADLFDRNRANAALASLYALDFASVDAIRSTFAGLAPVNEQAVRSLSAQSINLLQNFNDERLRLADQTAAGGKIAVTGRPLELAQMSLSPTGQPLGAGLMALQDGAEDTTMTEADLPENIAIFLSGGYVTGDVDSLPGFTEETEVTGFFISGGVEYYPGENTMIGVSGYFGALEADVPLGQEVESETYAGSVYARHAFEGGPVIDGQFSIGSMGFDTERTVQFLGAAQTLESTSDDLLISGALGISYAIESGIGTFSPGIEARYASVDLSPVSETGGTVGLAIARENFKSTQTRFGFDFEKQGKVVSLNANAQLVWEFEDGPQLLGANFATGTGPNANFVLGTADQTWGEVGLSLTAGTGPFQVSIGADTTIGHDTAEAQVVHGTATFRF